MSCKRSHVGFHPAILSKGGLGAAIKTLARRSTMPVNLEIEIQPALAVTVRADVDNENLDLLIRDDGVAGADSGRGSGFLGSKTVWKRRGPPRDP